MCTKPSALPSSRWDKAGMFLTSLCLVHCLVLPLLISTLTLWGIDLLSNPILEGGILFAGWLVGGKAMSRGFRKYRRVDVPLLFAAGMLLMTGATFFLPELAEGPAKAAGGLMVIAAHLANWKRSRTETGFLPLK